MNDKGRFVKFNEQARKVLSLAQKEAQRSNHSYIGTEHLLLGLVRVSDSTAARVLESLGVELAKLRTHTIQIVTWTSLGGDQPTDDPTTE
jgi:ATP-dependent Clp protease ATP-binding subunit ClpC